MGICVHYPIGRCIAGDQCQKKHIGPYQPFPCKNFIFYGKCKWGLKCQFGHPAPVPAESPEPSRPACKNFLSRRGCRYGSQCISYHPAPTDKVASSATSALQHSQSTVATTENLQTTKIDTIKSPKAKPANTTVAPLMNFRSARVRPQKYKVTPTTPNVSKDEGSTDVQISKDKPVGEMTMLASPKEFGVMPTLPLAESTTTMPMASKTTTATNAELSEKEPVNTTTVASKISNSAPVLMQAQATMDTPAVPSTAATVNMDSAYKKPAGKIPAPSIDPDSYENSLSPTKLTSVSNGTSDTGATNTDSSNDQPGGRITTPSESSDSTPETPSFQVLTPASTSIGSADDIGYVFSSDITPMSDSSDSVRSATQSPSPIDDALDTSMSTVPDDSSTPVKPVPFDQSIDEAPINGMNNTMLPTIPAETLIASSYTVPIESPVDSEQASVVQSTDPVLSANKSSNQTTTVALMEEKQISVMEHVSTDYQSAIGNLSRVVVDWSATLEPSNLELSGPGIYDRQTSHTEILFSWPQEWNVPANDMINTLIHLASTWGELSPYQPIHRNMGSWHSLQITFRHRHEAAAAAAAINGHLITAVGASMSIHVTVSHQIAVQYMIPRYIIDSLGRQNQGNLHQIFRQNSCQLHWGDSYRADYSGEKLMEVTIMGTCEEKVVQCKAVLEDLLRGRVLTHEEGDNRPLWHKFFKTEEGANWIREATTNVFDMKVRAAKLANLDILMVYGSSEWSRARFGALVKKKIAGLEEASVITAAVTEELRLMRLRVKG
ncbi:hypothetical protein BELL_0209g00100 [Botrytis elliptica]|uniref:C3H1-type domain-containing protein n=1 Tax=Botrytis elliptica TaxID=278938 RepID=A0A4Z1JQ85_9HELO|nr:hypothetical protein EAE99_009788 [Botrytis elliptica]TGO75514.1 hypothetical protein BELL_0209g00100 [Botrytis elliptica]